MLPHQHDFAFSSGDSINDFKVISVIGRGGFGEVYLVEDVSGARFALKLLTRAENREFAGNSQIRALENISGFAATHAAGTLPDGRCFFLMPPADNINSDCENVYTPDTLANRLSKFGRLPATELFDIAIKIASACSELHKKQLVHGDVKPENIIFVRKQALLSDFSLVRPMAPPDASGISGTLHFIPKEEVSGQLNGVSAQLDLYAIGMLLYTSFNLRPAIDYPAPGDEINLVEYRIIRKIYNKALNPNPAFRYRDADALIRDLKTAKAKIESGKTPWFRRKKNIYTLTGTMLVFILAFSLWTAKTLHDQRFMKQPDSNVEIDLDAINIEDYSDFFEWVDKELLDLTALKAICDRRNLRSANDSDYIFLCKKIDHLRAHKQLFKQLISSPTQSQARKIKKQLITDPVPDTPGDIMTSWRKLVTPKNFMNEEDFALYRKTPTSTEDPKTHLATYGATELNRAKIKIETLSLTSEFSEFQKAIDDFLRLAKSSTSTQNK